MSAVEKFYQDGLAAAKAAGLSIKRGAGATGPDAIHAAAQDRVTAAGGALVTEEQAKRAKHPFEMWDEMAANAEAGRFPKGTDVFLYKYHGLFYVAPAQDSFMCRLRVPNGILNSHQARGLAELSRRHAGGTIDVTTRANFQIREIPPTETLAVLTGLVELGLTARGSGADNIRNVTGGPTAGIDPQELIDTRPHALAWHHHILNHRELYGLPRKFNVAFDGGGRIGALEDTNDIGFAAVAVPDGKSVPAGVYYRLALGGVTGHLDFARDTGVLLKPDRAVKVAHAIVRVFIEHGDRTDRRKARLKYLLDAWGFERFLEATEALLDAPLIRLPLTECLPRGPIDRHGHVGIHPQRQPGLFYAGLVLPVGRLTADQLSGVADLAARLGSGTLRLTVWQNLLVSDLPEAALPEFTAGIAALGLGLGASAIRGGLIACTGSRGCKFSAADTKGHALALVAYLEPRVALDEPINIHFTGCHHSCAQHYIGDIGLIATKVGEAAVEGYSIHVGGGYGADRAIARLVWPDQPFEAVPPLIERLLKLYLARRVPGEGFAAFTRRHPLDPETMGAF